MLYKQIEWALVWLRYEAGTAGEKQVENRQISSQICEHTPGLVLAQSRSKPVFNSHPPSLKIYSGPIPNEMVPEW